MKNNKIEIKWEVINNEGKAKICLSATNNFKVGGKDDHKLMAEVTVPKGLAGINVKPNPSSKMPHNYLNRGDIEKNELTEK